MREIERIVPPWAWALIGLLLLGNLALAASGALSRRRLAAVRRRAATDPLTGLPNRRFLQESLTRMGAQAGRTGAPLAAVLFDLDHFKDVNDRLGHAAGDEVLARVARIARGQLRASDVVGRHGGEEFLLLLPDTDRDGAVTAAEHLRAAIAEHVAVGGDQCVTASLGVAVLPDDASSVEALVARADDALYVAKEAGRDRVEAYAAATPVAV